MSNSKIKLVDQHGQPLQPAMERVMAMPQPRADLSGMAVGQQPYEAGSFGTSANETWNSYLYSIDNETNPQRDVIVARMRELVRNDGWATGLIDTMADSVIGPAFRLNATPDYLALSHLTGNKKYDSVWADEYRMAAESAWRTWAEDPARWCDKERQLTMQQMMYLAFRHKVIDGDCIAVMHWTDNDVKPGQARYATRFQLIDPDLLSNPNLQYDNQMYRGGVELNGLGVPVAYHFRKSHQGNWWDAGKTFVWERIERETSWGRPVVIHDFEKRRAGQHKGGVGLLAPILMRFKMLHSYDKVELEAAVLQATLPMYVKSPYDPAMVASAMGEQVEVNAYNDFRMSFHDRKRFAVNGARIPMLFPGEDITSVDTTRPHSNFAGFENAILRSISSATGLSAEQVSHDYSQTNYSSNRAAMLEAWKSIQRRRGEFIDGFARPIYSCWLEEAMANGELPLPKGGEIADFGAMRASYSNCDFYGPARGSVDPTKEAAANILSLDAGLATLKDLAAEQGKDWIELLSQRKIEMDKINELGLPLMAWTGSADIMAAMQGSDDKGEEPMPAKKTITKPEPV